MHHFFLQNQVLAREESEVFALRLDADDAQHAKVLRLAPGEHISIVDAAQDYFECEVVEAGDDISVRISSRLADTADIPSVVLVQGLCKGEKMDMVIRHATELGVGAFVPLECARSVVKLDEKKRAKKIERWRTIAKSAAMQSGQMNIPEVVEPRAIGDLGSLLGNATCVLVCWEQAQRLSIGTALRQALAAMQTPALDARVAVIVGPEGGFEESEVQQLLSCNERCFCVSLGPSVLRTETAGIVASALAMYELGGLR